MLFMVESFPVPSRPSDVAATRLAGGAWLDELRNAGQVVAAYPKVGRGMVTIFSVSNAFELHLHLDRWAEFVPCRFELTPLVDPAEQRRMLGGTDV